MEVGKRKKTGGRTKGTPNKLTAANRQWILENGNPLEFLAQVQRGEPVGDVVPTLEQRIRVAGMLLDKVLPNLKAVAVEGDLSHVTEGELLACLGMVRERDPEMDERAILVAADAIRRRRKDEATQ